MAGLQTVGWPSVPPDHFYDLKAEPLGWWQRHIRWLPFLKDTKPRFRVTVTCVGCEVPSQTLNFFIMFDNQLKTSQTITTPSMKKGERNEYMIGDRLLGYGGDTILGVDLPSGGFHTLVSFWTLRGETILYGVLLSLLSGFVGALFTWMITRSPVPPETSVPTRPTSEATPTALAPLAVPGDSPTSAPDATVTPAADAASAVSTTGTDSKMQEDTDR